jgi:predicted DCC family thiol-disulfide oxidoreductase YuxK
VNTEITDIKNWNGCVCFDAECRLCVSLACRFRPLLNRHGFALLPLQTPWVRDRLANTGEEPLSEMRLIPAQGRVHGGTDALAEIARHIWWAKPFYWLARIPLVDSVLHSGYGWVVQNRTCLGGSCAVRARKPHEGLAEPVPPCDSMPAELAPRIRFTWEQIRKGLPPPGPFTWHEFRCCGRNSASSRRRKSIPFFEMP